jgi:hypothetical protein
VKFLTGILKPDGFHPAEPWRDEQEQGDMDKKPKNALTPMFEGVSDRIEQERRRAAEPDQAIALGEARALVDAVRAAGAPIELVDDGKVRVTGVDRLPPGTVDRLKANRDAIVRLLAAERGA